MPLLALVAIFVVVPLAELYVIFKVGDAIGWLPTIAILAADSILGSVLLKTQGRAVWTRFNDHMRAGRVPHQEVIDGVLVIFGGAFLITPGFLTDILGFLLLLPPTRAAFRRLVARRLERRTVVAASRYAAGRTRARRGPGFDVEGTAYERDDVDFELPPRSGEPRGGPSTR